MSVITDMVHVHQIFSIVPLRSKACFYAFLMPEKFLSALAVPKVEDIEVFHDKRICDLQEMSPINV